MDRVTKALLAILAGAVVALTWRVRELRRRPCRCALHTSAFTYRPAKLPNHGIDLYARDAATPLS